MENITIVVYTAIAVRVNFAQNAAKQPVGIFQS